MERCDFASAMTIIRGYISEAYEVGQVDLIYELFNDYLNSEDSPNFILDSGAVCRWMKGIERVSPQITEYYLRPGNHERLAKSLRKGIFPRMTDLSMAVRKLYDLVALDLTISPEKRQKLTEGYSCPTEEAEADFIAQVLLFGMSREFVRRDNKHKKLPITWDLSPVLTDYVMGNEVPSPCRYFCGRERELKQLHEMLTKHGKVFLHGIAGIGKSELAKSYAKQYKKEYRNLLYLVYSGDLKQDIISLDFVEDRLGEDEQARFYRHNRFLHTLKSDTLLIIDNFNTTAVGDAFLPELMKYHCHILLTTRSRMENYPTLLLEEISEPDTLLKLMGNYYSDAEAHRAELVQIIETVHEHTFAVELAARLLEHGLLGPAALLKKLQEEKIGLNDSNTIFATKDGVPMKETYYGHIHTLFSLYLLSAEQKVIMCGMAFMPLTGIPMKKFAEWLSLHDLNTVNDLIETGFITPQPGRCISLHPMIREITIADEKPTITSCRTLCENLRKTCLLHGIDLSYYKLLLTAIENIIMLAEKDDYFYYLRFLEDVFPCMEKYHYAAGMQLILDEKSRLLDRNTFARAASQALYLEEQATCEQDAEKAIQLEKEALSFLRVIRPDNALLASNIYANLGALYYKTGNIALAKQNMEAGGQILRQYNLTQIHDSVMQTNNYAALLMSINEPEKAIRELRELTDKMKKYNSSQSSDYAEILTTMGEGYLIVQDFRQAIGCFKEALQIYQTLWNNEPMLLEQKRKEIVDMFKQYGISFSMEQLP